MKLRPLHDLVIIKRDKPLESLLRVPDKPGNTGEVVAIGPRVIEVNVGARVQFNPYAGLDVTAKGHTWLIINEAEISVIFDLAKVGEVKLI
ncbi:co-chaperone GroES [Vibrio cholerae]|uniref:co-chaperone GroES n=1 Tax=Vibrio cholerae TaxID=666 RepID=UPI001558AEA7|nr:co-chaperone GroES [Vibrio cholerae]EGR4148510.1 co-chaperone GroES [Vibrio cholerae]